MRIQHIGRCPRKRERDIACTKHRHMVILHTKSTRRQNFLDCRAFSSRVWHMELGSHISLHMLRNHPGCSLNPPDLGVYLNPDWCMFYHFLVVTRRPQTYPYTSTWQCPYTSPRHTPGTSALDMSRWRRKSTPCRLRTDNQAGCYIL